MMQCFSLAVNYFKHYNNYTTNQIISLISVVQHLHYEIEQSFLRLCFIGAGGGRVGWEKKSVCCYVKLQSSNESAVLFLSLSKFITAATDLPILEGYISVNVRKNSKFENSNSVFSFTLSWGVGVGQVLFCFFNREASGQTVSVDKNLHLPWLNWNFFVHFD